MPVERTQPGRDRPARAALVAVGQSQQRGGVPRLGAHGGDTVGAGAGGERQLLAAELGEAGDERGPAGVHAHLGRLDEPAVRGEVVGDRRDPPGVARIDGLFTPRLRRPRLLDDVARLRGPGPPAGDDEHLVGEVRLLDAAPELAHREQRAGAHQTCLGDLHRVP